MVSPNPGLLAALLKTGRLNGVMRWKVVLADDTVKQECLSAGWRSLVLDTHGAKSLDDVLQVSVSDLGLAADDAASVSAWEKAIVGLMSQDTPACLTWVGWQDIIARSAADAAVVVGVFEDVLKDQAGLVLIAGHQGNFPNVDELAMA